MPKKIIDLRVECNDEGIQISLQSDVNWTPIYGRNEDFTLLGVVCHAAKVNLLNEINEAGAKHKAVFNKFTAPIGLFEGDSINATFLQAKDIATGVTFRLPASTLTPSSRDKMEDFKNRLSKVAQALFMERVKPHASRVVITTSDYQIA